jgi:hypothetical protein
MTLTIESIARLVAGQTAWRPASRPFEGACWFEDGDRRIHVAAGASWVQLARRLREPALDHEAMLIESLRMHMAKFALDASGRPVLRVEVPQVSLDPDYLLRAVAALDRAHNGPPHRRPLASEAPRLGHEMIPPDELYVFVRTLTHEGWIVKDHVGENHWRLTHFAADRMFRVDLGFNRSWACFQIALRPRELTISEMSRGHLARYLLRYNEVSYWAKLGLGGTDQVVLSLDLPIEAFDLERLRLAARTLARYAVATSTEVQVLSRLDTEPTLWPLLNERLAPPERLSRLASA